MEEDNPAGCNLRTHESLSLENPQAAGRLWIDLFSFFLFLISHLRENWLGIPEEEPQKQQQQEENPVSCDLIQISTYIVFTMYITANQYEP